MNVRMYIFLTRQLQKIISLLKNFMFPALEQDFDEFKFRTHIFPRMKRKNLIKTRVIACMSVTPLPTIFPSKKESQQNLK